MNNCRDVDMLFLRWVNLQYLNNLFRNGVQILLCPIDMNIFRVFVNRLFKCCQVPFVFVNYIMTGFIEIVSCHSVYYKNTKFLNKLQI